jgi:hypothetical protein
VPRGLAPPSIEQSPPEVAPDGGQLPAAPLAESVTTEPSSPVVQMLDAPLPADAAPVIDIVPITGRFYGFIEEVVNATSAEPNGNVRPNGNAGRNKPVLDLALPAFHIMAQGTLYQRFRFYFNLAAPDADRPVRDTPVGLRNAWLESSLFGDYLNLRIGKLYRRFGLYNEILDTLPSFIGVETPASITGSRPMLTRTTNLMVHGKAGFESSTFSYALMAGKDESTVDDAAFSPGLDLNYDWDSTILVGMSYYTTAGTVIPDTMPGAGSPAGGVASWMTRDRYQVYGGYARLTLGAFLFQAEAWVSPHHATRDPDKVLLTAQNAADFNPANRARFGVDAGSPSADAVNRTANYSYRTVEARMAYSFEFGSGDDLAELTPYLNFEYIDNRESIADVAYGGDSESGQSPRGIMMHNRLGLVIKPVPVVAVKAEVTIALYDYGNRYVSDAELWLALSYQWELIHQ